MNKLINEFSDWEKRITDVRNIKFSIFSIIKFLKNKILD